MNWLRWMNRPAEPWEFWLLAAQILFLGLTVFLLLK